MSLVVALVNEILGGVQDPEARALLRVQVLDQLFPQVVDDLYPPEMPWQELPELVRRAGKAVVWSVFAGELAVDEATFHLLRTAESNTGEPLGSSWAQPGATMVVLSFVVGLYRLKARSRPLPLRVPQEMLPGIDWRLGRARRALCAAKTPRESIEAYVECCAAREQRLMAGSDVLPPDPRVLGLELLGVLHADSASELLGGCRFGLSRRSASRVSASVLANAGLRSQRTNRPMKAETLYREWGNVESPPAPSVLIDGASVAAPGGLSEDL